MEHLTSRLLATLLTVERVDGRFWLLGVCLGVALTIASSGRAQGRSHVGLRYDASAAAGCPGESDFRNTVTELLGYDPFVPTATRSVSVEISGTSGGLYGLLQWRNERGELEGERRFDSPVSDCRKLARNMAFAVTVQIQLYNAPPTSESPSSSQNPSSSLGPSAAQGPPASKTANPDSERPAAAQPRPPQPSSAPAPHFQMGGGAGPFVVFGWAPHASPGGELFLVGRNDRLAIELGFGGSLASRFERHDKSGFETSVLATNLRPCVRFEPIQACAVFRFGRVRVRGFGVDDPRSPRGFFSQAGLRFSVAPELAERLELRVHAEVVGTPAPWRVELNQKDTYTSPPFSFLLGVDLATFFF